MATTVSRDFASATYEVTLMPMNGSREQFTLTVVASDMLRAGEAALIGLPDWQVMQVSVVK